MHKIYNGQFKQTRVRLNPIKKWTVAEEKALLSYLLNNPQIDKPTAQAYYRRFCEENNFNISWKTVRSKVKNMRSSFLRTKSWERSIEAAALTKEQIENGVLRKCNYYQELEAIFGKHVIDFDTKEECFGSENSNFLTSIVIDSDNVSQMSDNDNFPSISCRSDPIKMEIKPDLVDIKSDQTDPDLSFRCLEMGLKESELSFKERILLMEIKLKERRLELKEKQLISKEKIKLHAINSNEKLKIMELEMKERIAKEEMKLKFK